jgi:hypothetical protein
MPSAGGLLYRSIYPEAVARGLRVVGGTGGGSGDAIADKRVGVRVDPADSAALAGASSVCWDRGRSDPAAIEAFRLKHFTAATRLLAAFSPSHARGERHEFRQVISRRSSPRPAAPTANTGATCCATASCSSSSPGAT